MTNDNSLHMKDKNSHHHPLLQPLLPTTTTTSILHRQKVHHDISIQNSSELDSSSGFLFRFALVISFGIISIWANNEASKGHTITIVNEAQSTVQGKRFDLFYGSNGKASRMVYDTSRFLETFLYPNDHNHINSKKKLVNHFLLRLSSSGTNMTTDELVVVAEKEEQEFVISISSSVMDELNHGRAMLLAVQKGMAGVWLWDGEGKAPKSLVNGIVEYITGIAATHNKNNSQTFNQLMSIHQQDDDDYCYWKDKILNNDVDANAVADFLNYYERKRPGLIRRLNQELRSRWPREQTLGSAPGMPSWDVCVP